MAGTLYRRDIDGLRALAVVPVVLGHAGLSWFSGGFVGVDVFFVISGYLITGILARELASGQFSILRFYERRARRILPALFAMLAVCLIGGYFILTPEMLKGLGKSTGATLLFASNMWFWRTAGDYFGNASELEPLLHTWSLAVEEQFYIAFPLILWAVASRGRGAMIALVAVLSALSFALSVWATPRLPGPNFYFALTRAWELGLGALLALMAGTRAQEAPVTGRSMVRDAAGLIGLALIVGSVVFYDPLMPFPGMAAIPPCLGTVLILWSGAIAGGPAGRILSWAPFVWIGLISYSLYLWHWPVQVMFRVLGNSVDLSFSGIAVSVVAALLLGWLSWRYIERPFRRPAPNGFGRAAIFGMSFAGGTVLAAISAAVLLTQGMPWRIPAPTLTAYSDAIQLSPLRDACMGHSPDEKGGLCRIGAEISDMPSTVLVWGDSHADALLPGVEEWMSQNRLSGYASAKVGCPPLLGLTRADLRPNHGCNAHNEAVMAFLERTDSIKTVVLHARWTIAVEGVRAPGELGTPFVFASQDDPSGPASYEQNHDLVAAALHKTVKRIRASGRKVIIIDSVPEIGWSVPQALFSTRYVGVGMPTAPDLKAAEARNHRFRALVEPLLAKGHVRLVSLTEDLCTPICKVEIDGNALYRDDDHLSLWAARAFAPGLMDKAFTPL